MFPAVHNMYEFYRNSLSHQPIMSVEYWQNYEENTVVEQDKKKTIFPLICIFLCEILQIVW